MVDNVLTSRIEPIPFPTGERWDVVLTDAELRRLSASEKQRRVHAALSRKVARIQTAADSLTTLAGEPFLPHNRKSLRSWEDPTRGLWAWKDVKIDKPTNEKHRNTIKAFFKALADIDQLRKGKSSTLRMRLSEKDVVIQRLELRVATLLEEVNRLRIQVYGKR